jgi:16S rRNA (cytidine1402-2'-O)-methyltransferase
MPGISDPGSFLIREVIESGLPLEVLPGANAALVGFLQSGFASSQFLFYGFLPRRRKDRTQALEDLKELIYPIIFYEAPHRLNDMLDDLLQVLGDRTISVSRELTKRFEETIRGRVTELLAHFDEERPRGEFVVTVAGKDPATVEKKSEDDILHLLEHLMSSGLSRRTAVEQVSEKYRLPKNQVYELALKLNS